MHGCNRCRMPSKSTPAMGVGPDMNCGTPNSAKKSTCRARNRKRCQSNRHEEPFAQYSRRLGMRTHSPTHLRAKVCSKVQRWAMIPGLDWLRSKKILSFVGGQLIDYVNKQAADFGWCCLPRPAQRKQQNTKGSQPLHCTAGWQRDGNS